MDKLATMIREMGLPFSYHHFAEGESPPPPFIVYLTPGSDNFAADGTVYFKQNEVQLEVYTDEKSPGTEQGIEAVLDKHGLFYQKTETWIESERLYEVMYRFETEEEYG